ncbi:NAD(+)/NADH kinase [Microbacterium sp. JZ70]|uniref:Sphingosine kinase n=1 Tax=Microbacterium barkeri TaxID=33917 RepID=A0A9W6H311_9MICO|nr:MULTISPECIES: diacylglycerol kinase family protein [Microbacterium]MDI6943599.1 diacylglycerol kinase family protein [Microbacterium barkeri]MDR6875546.1 diacylglycerol kinase family enzyme [Microbacterium barkeri]WRH17882.1 diacylglycerol kinase [Microbacterium sp. JZ37]GLJ61605.1 sphingosine kinase [Microbacterium barkeri]
MALERIAIVWNPSKTEREVLETGLAAALGDDEREISWWETTVEDPGQKATEDALEWGADVIVAAGGDGTVRAVAERLAEPGAGAELAIVPLGTGNLLARNLDIPLNNPQAAFARALADEARVIDIGWIETAVDGAPTRQAFAVMAGFGIDAHMIVETDDDLKSKVGWLAYVESLGRAVNASEVIELRIAVDGGEAVTAAGHTLMVGNCGMLQGGITLLPDADPSDGELDLLLLSAEGIAGWLDTLRSFVWDNGIRRLMGATDRAESGDTAAHARATSVAVELPEPRVLEVDGDDLGEVTQFTVEIQPGALRVR